MKKSLFVLTLLIGFAALIISSCSKSSNSTPAPTPPPVAGAWARSSGTVILSLTLNNDYTYSLLSSGASQETGTFAIAAPSITFNANSGSASQCAGKPGKYTYVIQTVGNNTTINFAMVSDSCSMRSGSAVGTWNKQ